MGAINYIMKLVLARKLRDYTSETYHALSYAVNKNDEKEEELVL